MDIKQYQRFGNISIDWSEKADTTVRVEPRGRSVFHTRLNPNTSSFLISITVDSSCKRVRVQGFKNDEVVWDTEVWGVLVSTSRQQKNTQLLLTDAKAFRIEVENLTNGEGEIGVSWSIGELPEMDVVTRLGELS
jgi:hypothetical protein